jgi:hypothetical protein
MANDIYVDPDATDASVIVVDGVCYELVGPSGLPPNVTSVSSDQEFDDCDTCEAVPCTCPPGLADVYYLTVPAGRNPEDGYTWGGTFPAPLTPVCNWSTNDCPYPCGDGSINNGFGIYLAEDETGCYWLLQFGAGDYGQDVYRKYSGSTPEGTYTRDVSGDHTICPNLPNTLVVS